MTPELKALIEDLRLNHEFCPKEVILQAADELERLAQPEPEPVQCKLCDDSGVGSFGVHSMCICQYAKATPLQRTEQEPVGVVHHKLTSTLGADYEQVAVFVRPLEPGTKLYTHPPQRTWVGLTDEERRGLREWQKIQEELAPVWAPMMLYLYEALEAKLKEKNT